MKQYPILFSTAMVQAILAGRKTRTRRIMKPQVELCNHKAFTYAPWKDDPTKFVESFSDKGFWYCQLCGNGTGNSNEFKGIKFPYGQVGDVLWVRETWCIIPHGPDSFGPYLYKSMGDEPYGKWKPSIHMPKSVCRLYLQITDIRVERLNEISEEDAKAEGLACLSKDGGITYKYGIPDKDGLPGIDNHGWPWQEWNTKPVEAFKTLWGKVNGLDSWQANPWVWVITFKRIDNPNQ